jgi:hypothetical protein
MAGYIRQDVSNNIANGNVIDADDFDNEFDALASAFSATTGHTHDGSSAEGAPITVVGPDQDVVVSATAVTPKADNTYDLGSPSNEWKDLYIDGTANIDNLVADTGTVGGEAITTAASTQTLTNKTINLSNNTLVATSAQLATALTDETGTGFVVFSDGPTLNGVVLNDGYTEEVFAVTGTTPALSPTNGSIQTWTLSGNSTPTAGTWAAGQSITLLVDDGTDYTITWTSLSIVWKTDGGSAPTLNTSGDTVIGLWKVGTTIYGARVGDA